MELSFGAPLHGSPASVVTIGNFDGLHLGHQALLQRLDAVGRAQGLKRVVLTFEPLPREVFAPQPVPRLMSLREKAAWLAASGQVDALHILRFTPRLAKHPAEDFVRDILVGQLRARHVLIGDDFRFGQGRRGDFALLQRLGAEHGFAVESCPPVRLDGERISSTRVRAALSAGRLDEAKRLLGRPYSLCARVTHGDKRGRLLGFPTLNLPLGRQHFALHGVFVVEVLGLAGQPLYGVANAGVRPTVGGVIPRVEAHVFDWAGDAYGQRVEVRFLALLREERRFANLEELKTQIARDAAATRRFLAGEFKANRE